MTKKIWIIDTTQIPRAILPKLKCLSRAFQKRVRININFKYNNMKKACNQRAFIFILSVFYFAMFLFKFSDAVVNQKHDLTTCGTVFIFGHIMKFTQYVFINSNADMLIFSQFIHLLA